MTDLHESPENSVTSHGSLVSYEEEKGRRKRKKKKKEEKGRRKRKKKKEEEITSKSVTSQV